MFSRRGMPPCLSHQSGYAPVAELPSHSRETSRLKLLLGCASMAELPSYSREIPLLDRLTGDTPVAELPSNSRGIPQFKQRELANITSLYFIFGYYFYQYFPSITSRLIGGVHQNSMKQQELGNVAFSLSLILFITFTNSSQNP